MWVNQTPWTVERKFDATPADIDGYLTLTLENVDTIATVILNGEAIAETQNQFIRYDIDVTGKVKVGANTLRIEFAVTRDVAKARSDAHPFPIPFTNNYLVERPRRRAHELRAQGRLPRRLGLGHLPDADRRLWQDGDPRARACARQESVTVEQAHGKKSVELSITTRVFAFAEGSVELTHEVDGQKLADKVVVRPGENALHPQCHHQEPKALVAERAGRAAALRAPDHARWRGDQAQARAQEARMAGREGRDRPQFQGADQRPRHLYVRRKLDPRRRHPVAHHPRHAFATCSKAPGP